ncbi:hypothetical protein ELI34_25315 (plasmid) [Rhizobium ruizarguesonis]|nr:hypothetical protein ELI34_25315 [Rhizobium ruizarguesonis]
MWSPFVLSKQTESQLADFTQLFFGQALRPARPGARPEPVEVAAWSVIEAEHVTGENVVVSRCEIYVGATPSRRGHWCCERVDRLREMG